MLNVAITTKDNPYDPVKEFDSWLLFDSEKGYNTCSYLARILDTLPDDGSTEDEKVDRAINEILRYDIFNIYKKIEDK